MRWTTIELSPGGERIRATEAERNAAYWKHSIISFWIPAVLGFGLLTAFAYLGIRVVGAKSQAVLRAPKQAPAPAIASSKTSLAPSPSVQAPRDPRSLSSSPKKSPKAADTAGFTVLNPQHGERYLQVAAVSPQMVLTYVDNLKKINFDAVVAPGPSAVLMRILVGPFSDRDALEKTKVQLEAAGKFPIIRTY
jgi:cell division septation protein DedD